MSRPATNQSTPANAAKGIMCANLANGESTRAPSPATSRTSFVRPPANFVTVVRAGLALTGKAPTSPHATFASPTPRSRD